MSEKYKVGLSRNRLFEFDNAVVFLGKLQGYSSDELAKALKVLALKEPLITARAILCDNGECFVETDAVVPALSVSELAAKDIKKAFSDNGLDYSQNLFSFTLSADGYIVVAAHTLVADCKSLLRLAMSFAELCESRSASVIPSRLEMFPDTASLPLEINSPLTDKLSAELDSGWQKKSKVFSFADYSRAAKKYASERNYSDEVRLCLNEVETEKLKEYCKGNNLDLSSVVAFAFYKSLLSLVGTSKKHNKLCIHADRRLFLSNAQDVFVGAFNGMCEAYLGDKEQKLTLDEQIKAFHSSCYKGVTSPFKTFYDEVLLMKLSPSYCDSAYMYLAGEVSGKVSEKLACNYGCCNEQLGEFFSCNLDQEYWSALKRFEDVSVTEPLKNRFGANISLIMVDCRCVVTVKFNKSRIAPEYSDAIFDDIKTLLNSLK